MRDLADPEIWIERYETPTWLDYVRLNNRMTRHDAVIPESLRALHRWVAQELVNLSTHPVFDGYRLSPRHVDLRAFVFSGRQVEVAPAALTRVAPAGSMIVNSSRGGGAKDTWLLS